MYLTKNRNHNYASFNSMDRVINELFSSAFNNISKHQQTGFTFPAANVIEQENQFQIHMAIPGMDKEDIELALDKNVLSISAKKENEVTGKAHVTEFNYSTFSRKFRLPKEVNQESINAEMDNGVLKITLAKKEEAIDHGPKQIEIL